MDEPVFQVRDRWGRDVVLAARGIRHITRRHPDMLRSPDLIAETVTAPDLVAFDAEHANRENYYRLDRPGSMSDRRYVKVCVEFGSGGGEVITAYRTPRTKRGEMQRWP